MQDDDGWTVECDKCYRWQHTVCYYPEFEGRSLPEDLQHFCVECKPRAIDAAAAASRQRLLKELRASPESGTLSRKKIKDAVFSNDWPLDMTQDNATYLPPVESLISSSEQASRMHGATLEDAANKFDAHMKNRLLQPATQENVVSSPAEQKDFELRRPEPQMNDQRQYVCDFDEEACSGLTFETKTAWR